MSRKPHRAARRARRVLAFLGSYTRMAVISNLRVSGRILRPRVRSTAVIVEVPLRSRTRAEIATFVALVSLPPGTVVLEVAEKPVRAWVHGMQDEGPDRLRTELHELEERFLRAWRPPEAPSDTSPGAPSDTSPDGPTPPPASPTPEEGPR